MKTTLILLQFLFLFSAFAQTKSIVLKTVTDTVSGRKTVIKKTCYNHPEIKSTYEDFVTSIKVYDKNNNLINEGVYLKTDVPHRHMTFRHLSKRISDNHYIIGQQKNNKRISVTEYVNGKIVKTKKIETSDLYWDDWFEHYSAVCAN